MRRFTKHALTPTSLAEVWRKGWLRKLNAGMLAGVLSMAVLTPSAQADPAVGVIFNDSLFDDDDGNGIDEGYFITRDFADSEVNNWTSSNLQYFRIQSAADNNGDNAMFRSFSASNNQSYKATATLKLTDMDLSGGSLSFRGRLKVAAWDGNEQLKECNAILDTSAGTGYHTITTGTCRMPLLTDTVRIRVGANLQHPASFGTVVVSNLKFERLE